MKTVIATEMLDQLSEYFYIYSVTLKKYVFVVQHQILLTKSGVQSVKNYNAVRSSDDCVCKCNFYLLLKL